MDIAQTAASAFKRLAQFIHAYPHIRDSIAQTVDEHDGYPTSVIGASPPIPGPPVVYEGYCSEPLGHHVGPDDRYSAEPFAGSHPAICRMHRPCPRHDTPVKLTSVEQAAISRKGNKDRDELEKALRKITEGLDVLERVRARHAERGPTERCNAGAGRKDQHIWGNPTCEQIPDPRGFGMCLDCLARLNAYETAHGLPVTQRSDPGYLDTRGVRRGDRGRFTAA